MDLSAIMFEVVKAVVVLVVGFVFGKLVKWLDAYRNTAIQVANVGLDVRRIADRVDDVGKSVGERVGRLEQMTGKRFDEIGDRFDDVDRWRAAVSQDVGGMRADVARLDERSRMLQERIERLESESRILNSRHSGARDS